MILWIIQVSKIYHLKILLLENERQFWILKGHVSITISLICKQSFSTLFPFLKSVLSIVESGPLMIKDMESII